ncbi:hypothetical protein H6G11_11575 [Cyanobacterium aponinum FACHB-4101]|uniref:Uncharacterized protein n=2 Tax=Cyanobacterium TaxID=102234 RepID=K9Z316_CYAAP|nr:hypothetical protein Cyan10605_1490 [Cyanobacterium aponinum PCC 10605]MBD2394892.1 hypothetical protein [Cyanobacterium aponinum FACHB-4101]
MQEKIKKELKKVGSLTLFFLIGFAYILITMKFLLAEYDIDVYVFSKTIISALVAAKVVAIMDAMPFINLYSNSPGYIRVMYKSLIYVGGVFIISLVEDLFHTYRQVNSIQGAISIFIETRHFFHFMAVTMSISLVFIIHNIFYEIDSYLGKGKLAKLFFEKPTSL